MPTIIHNFSNQDIIFILPPGSFINLHELLNNYKSNFTPSIKLNANISKFIAQIEASHNIHNISGLSCLRFNSIKSFRNRINDIFLGKRPKSKNISLQFSTISTKSPQKRLSLIMYPFSNI